MSYKTICRISLSGYGVIPSEFWIEARSLSHGFSIVFYDDDYQQRPKRLFATRSEYTTQLFAGSLRKLSPFTTLDEESWPYIEVSGANGIDALILKSAFCSHFHQVADYVSNSDSDSIALIEDNVSFEDISQLKALDELIEKANHLSGGWSLMDLINRYDLPKDWHGILLLSETIEEKIESDKAHRVEEHQNAVNRMIKPFENEVKFIAEQFDNSRHRGAGGIHPPSKRQIITHWLKEYIHKNSSLPSGKHEVNYIFYGKKTLGMIDFSEILNRKNVKN